MQAARAACFFMRGSSKVRAGREDARHVRGALPRALLLSQGGGSSDGRYWTKADKGGFRPAMVCPLMTQSGHRSLEGGLSSAWERLLPPSSGCSRPIVAAGSGP